MEEDVIIDDNTSVFRCEESEEKSNSTDHGTTPAMKAQALTNLPSRTTDSRYTASATSVPHDGDCDKSAVASNNSKMEEGTNSQDSSPVEVSNTLLPLDMLVLIMNKATPITQGQMLLLNRAFFQEMCREAPIVYQLPTDLLIHVLGSLSIEPKDRREIRNAHPKFDYVWRHNEHRIFGVWDKRL